MINAMSAAEAAIFAALSDGSLDAPVYQHAPTDTPLPVAIIGDIDSRPLDTKGSSPDRIVTVTISTETAGEERAPLLALQAQIFALLDGKTLTGAAGWEITGSIESESAMLAPEGKSYIGAQTFVAFALRA